MSHFALAGDVHGYATGVVSAAIRLLPISNTDCQGLMFRVQGAIQYDLESVHASPMARYDHVHPRAGYCVNGTRARRFADVCELMWPTTIAPSLDCGGLRRFSRGWKPLHSIAPPGNGKRRPTLPQPKDKVRGCEPLTQRDHGYNRAGGLP